jgi:hypothetical protein
MTDIEFSFVASNWNSGWVGALMADVIQSLGLEDGDIDAMTRLNFSSATDPKNKVDSCLSLPVLALAPPQSAAAVAGRGVLWRRVLLHEMCLGGQRGKRGEAPAIFLRASILRLNHAAPPRFAVTSSAAARTSASATSGRRRSGGGSRPSPRPCRSTSSSS